VSTVGCGKATLPGRRNFRSTKVRSLVAS
jgi:hypothetical protein